MSDQGYCDLPGYEKIVFAAMSKNSFYMREHIIKFILEQGFTPTCAFMMFSYFLLGTVDKAALISANNALIKKSDELWVFGPISGGVKKEIELAEALKIPIKYFIFNNISVTFTQVERKDAPVEQE